MQPVDQLGYKMHYYTLKEPFSMIIVLHDVYIIDGVRALGKGIVERFSICTYLQSVGQLGYKIYYHILMGHFL